MDTSQASVKLNEQADKCLNCIQELADRAERARQTRRTSSTATLLENVKRNANNSLRLLQTWKKDFSKGKITNDTQLVDTTNGYFETLRHWIEAAWDALDSRLFFRKLFFIGFVTSKRLVHRCCAYEAFSLIDRRKHFEKRLSQALRRRGYDWYTECTAKDTLGRSSKGRDRPPK